MRTQLMIALVAVSVTIGCGPQEDARRLLGGDNLTEFTLTDNSPEGAALEVAEVDGAPVLRVAAPTEKGSVRIEAPVAAAAAEGDVLLARFRLRPASGKDEARIEVRFEPGLSRWSSPLRMAARAANNWKTYEYPFPLRRAYEPGEGKLAFVVGTGQTVEIGRVELLDYGAEKRPDELPCTRLDYEGSAPNAAWRAAAEKRIEEHRKGELRVIVRDGAGKPVKDAAVMVRMKAHEFGFGTAISVPAWHGKSNGIPAGDVARYKEHILKLFNKAVFENSTKWPGWETPGTPKKVRETLAWLRDGGITVRGHVLIWPSWRWLPGRLKQLEDRPEELRAETLKHIRAIVTALQGQIAEWDVINEPFSNHDLMDILGPQVMVEWFQEARKADPDAELYINDYGILAGRNDEHRDHYAKTIRYLLDHGAPLGGIGLQAHFGSEVNGIDEVLAMLDRFAAFGKPLQVTEFDIDTVDEQLQADYTRDFMTALFSHPAAKGFLMWGFWEGRHWKPNGAMYRRDWTPKPNAEVYKELVFHKWWTADEGRTDDQGRFQTRGFLGKYEVEVKSGETVRKVEARLCREGTTVSAEI